MKIRCVDCGVTSELPEGFFDGAAVDYLLREHCHDGKLPGVVILICDCGERLAFGPRANDRPLATDLGELIRNASRSFHASTEWYLAHRNH